VGLNVDKQLADFRDMEREDKAFFEDLISGAEPELPPEVLSGTARMKLGSDMVVHQEVVSDFFEEDFLRSDDEAIYDELRAHAESLGLDAEAVVEAARKKEVEKVRRVKASAPFPVVPQAERREARKRLREEANRTAKLLLNRLGLDYGSRELPFKYAPGVTGSNFVAAVQMVNREVDKVLGIEPGKRGMLKTEDFARGMEALEGVLDTLTRRIKKRMGDG
jgi:hypothetical protein